MNDPLQVAETPKEDVAISSEPTWSETTPDILAKMPLARFLNVESPTSKEAENLQFVLEQLREEAGSSQTGDLLKVLREIELKLSTPNFGETRLSKVYNYLRVNASVKNATKTRDAYLK